MKSIQVSTLIVFSLLVVFCWSNSTSTTVTSAVLNNSANTSEDVVVVCPEGSMEKYGIEPIFGDNDCRSYVDCLSSGPATNKSLRIDAICTASEDKRHRRCCFKDTSNYCAQGVSVLPSQACSSFDECNTKLGLTTQRWCDPKTRMCCRNAVEHELMCPDNVTALMNEPLCTGFRKDDISSGKCPQPNGFCSYGHCCPKMSKSGTLLKGTPYRTNHKCFNNTIIEKEYVNGYCNAETSTIWIMSQVNFHNQPNRKTGYFCLTSRDCGQSNGRENVCVRLDDKMHQCYIDPEAKYYAAKKPDLVLISAFCYTALATSILSILFSMLFKYWRRDESYPAHSSSESHPLVSQQ